MQRFHQKVSCMELVRLKITFLSHSFLPVSPIWEYWTITHLHIPPSTLSGLLLRAILFSMNPRNIYGDFLPCEIGKGLLVKIHGQSAEWIIAEKEKVYEPFRPPYVEYHFRSVSLGAYDDRTLRGESPDWGYIEKYWNVIKYIDARDVHLLAPLTVGIKTWHFAAADGARLAEKRGEYRYQIYDVIKVKFDFPTCHLQGFILLDDANLANRLKYLANGWFIDKSRMKTLIAVKVDEIMEPTEVFDKDEKVYVLPSIERPPRPSYSFASAVISKEALRGLRRDISVERVILHAEKPKDIDVSRKMMFRSADGSLYAVDKSWLEYVGLSGRGK